MSRSWRRAGWWWAILCGGLCVLLASCQDDGGRPTSGSGPVFAISPRTLDFDSTCVGSAAPLRTLTIRNQGSEPLSVALSASGAPLLLSPVQRVLEPGESLSDTAGVPVRFAPRDVARHVSPLSSITSA